MNAIRIRLFFTAIFLLIGVSSTRAAWTTLREYECEVPLYSTGGSAWADSVLWVKVVFEYEGWFFRLRVVTSEYLPPSSQLFSLTPVKSVEKYFSFQVRNAAGTIILQSNGAGTGYLDRALGEVGSLLKDDYGSTKFTLVSTDKLTLAFMEKSRAANGSVIENNFVTVANQVPMGVTGVAYGAMINLPANGTDHAITYIALWGEKTLGSCTLQPGEAAANWYLGGLVSNTPDIVILEVTGGYITGTAGNYGLVSMDNPFGHPPTEYRTVATVKPTAETGPTGGATATVPVTPTPTVTSGTSTGTVPTVTVPTGGTSNPTAPAPSGTSGATKTDIMTMGNQVTAAIQAADGRALASANTTLTGINGVITAGNNAVRALDKINATLQAQAGQTSGTDMGPTNGLLTGVNEKLTTSNGHLQSIKESLTAQKTERDTAMTTGTAAATSMANSYSSGVAGEISAAQSRGAGMVSAFNAIPIVGQATTLAGLNPIPVDNHYATQANTLDVSNSATAAGISGGSLDLNPFTSPVLAAMIGAGTALTICTWIKGFICWSTVIAFMIWTAGQVKENIIAHFQVPQMALPASTQIVSRTAVFGNSVGVVPAAGLYAVQCVAMSSLLLSLPVLSAAIFFDTGQAGIMTAAATAAAGTTSGLTGMLANAASYMFIILPVATLVAAYVNRLLVQFTGITQFIVTGVVTRTITL